MGWMNDALKEIRLRPKKKSNEMPMPPPPPPHYRDGAGAVNPVFVTAQPHNQADDPKSPAPPPPPQQVTLEQVLLDIHSRVALIEESQADILRLLIKILGKD